MTERTALYRHFDDEGRLLYIGISLSALARSADHMRRSPRASEIATIKVEYHGSREAALDAERRAIVSERPIWNRAYNAANDNDPQIEDYAERMAAENAEHESSKMAALTEIVRAILEEKHALTREGITMELVLRGVLFGNVDGALAELVEARKISAKATSIGTLFYPRHLGSDFLKGLAA